MAYIDTVTKIAKKEIIPIVLVHDDLFQRSANVTDYIRRNFMNRHHINGYSEIKNDNYEYIIVLIFEKTTKSTININIPLYRRLFKIKKIKNNGTFR